MEAEKKNAKQTGQERTDPYYEISSVASATECTWMIPAPPSTEAELASYAEIDPMAKPSGRSKTDPKKKARAKDGLR